MTSETENLRNSVLHGQLLAEIAYGRSGVVSHGEKLEPVVLSLRVADVGACLYCLAAGERELQIDHFSGRQFVAHVRA